MQYWLIKSEPFKYPYSQLEIDGVTAWDGVRNFAARNNLRSMELGDLAIFYHSNEGKEAVGIAKVVRTSYQDPTTTDPNWLVVDFAPHEKFTHPVSLALMKSHPILQTMQIFKQLQLSVVSIDATQFETLVSIGRGKVV